MNRTNQTIEHVSEKSWTYPLRVSIRADELLAELDDRHIHQLQYELSAISTGRWFAWLETNRAKVAAYDMLTPAERAERLLATTAHNPLLLHHACIYLELWRQRINRRYFCFPPSGDPLDTPESQRRMIMDVVVSYKDNDDRDLWPFLDFPSPFRVDT